MADLYNTIQAAYMALRDVWDRKDEIKPVALAAVLDNIADSLHARARELRGDDA